MELSLGQTLVIGFIASVLAYGVKALAAWRGWKLKRASITPIALVISVILAYIWLLPKMVIPSDPMEAANYLWNQANAVLGVATLVYNVLLDKLIKLLGIEAERLLPLRV